MPRDRAAPFGPQLAPKYLREVYHAEVSAELISDVTTALVPLFQAWQSRPLEACYVAVFLDAIFVKVRLEGRVETRPLITALELGLSGKKEVLGLWLCPSERAPAYAQILSELQARGVKDVVVAATGGIAGAADTITAVFPQAAHQHCLVHQMRSSLALVVQKDRRVVASLPKAVYKAATESEAELRLEEAEAEWRARYGAVLASWHRH